MINVEEGFEVLEKRNEELREQINVLSQRISWLTDVIYAAFPSLTSKVGVSHEINPAGASERPHRSGGRVSR